MRHRMSLPVRGQRTRTNARTPQGGPARSWRAKRALRICVHPSRVAA
ncbi:MAG: hypothetical protein R3C56_18415 [Pirellulaceae bacterium]